jgi:hypothetical protein
MEIQPVNSRRMMKKAEKPAGSFKLCAPFESVGPRVVFLHASNRNGFSRQNISRRSKRIFSDHLIAVARGVRLARK